MERHTSKYHSFPCEPTNEYKEKNKDAKSPEGLNNSESCVECKKCLNIESNNEEANRLIS